MSQCALHVYVDLCPPSLPPFTPVLIFGKLVACERRHYSSTLKKSIWYASFSWQSGFHLTLKEKKAWLTKHWSELKKTEKNISS